ncbi:MAG: PQQ-binding-like beta-propeller repeat protein [Oligosphaeraceae bacterium]|nr:PQQ-binding-like beta-propeller repeat protein [Oligosphaeraceae bacterium]
MHHQYQPIATRVENTLRGLLSGLFLLLFAALQSSGAEVSQWRGEGHRGEYPEKGLLSNWPAGGPAAVWKTAGLGEGYSSPILVAGKVYFTGVQEAEGKKNEILSCLDAADGKLLWQTPFGQPWRGQYPVSRSTPSCSAGDIFVCSGSGEVAKLSADTGQLHWKIDAMKSFQGAPGGWGIAESLLVDDRAVYFTPGGKITTMVALDRRDGKTLWQSKSLGDKTSYVSPTAIRHHGIRQIVGATTNYVFGVNPADGSFAWTCQFAQILDAGRKIKRYDIIANSLLYRDGRLFLSNGYHHGAMLFQLNQNASAVEVLWTNLDLSSQHHGFVWYQDWIFATAHPTRKWTCLEAATGKTLFSAKVPQVGLGQVISADGMLYVYDADRGNMILAKPDPAGFQEVSRFPIRDGQQQHWCHPIIANGMLLLRHGDVGLAYRLK